MAREIRTLKRSFFQDEKLAALPREVRLTFMGLIPHADDYGRLRGDPRLVRAAIYPYDDQITASMMDAELDMLERAGRIVRYMVDGCRYIEIVNFVKHQNMARVYASDIPAPDSAGAVRTQCVDSARADREHSRSGDGIGVGDGKERSGVRAREVSIAEDDDPLNTEEPAAASAPLVELPREAEQFVERFYSLSSKKRRLDVIRQLHETLDPRRPGARLRRGVFAKARDPAHLSACCRAVLDDPPRDIDMAIVIVLQRLTNPPPGPTVTELQAKAESETRQLEERYQTEARSAGLAWSKEHPDEYSAILRRVEASIPPSAGAMGRMTRDAMLAQETARAAAFPSFDAWRQNGHRQGAA